MDRFSGQLLSGRSSPGQLCQELPDHSDLPQSQKNWVLECLGWSWSSNVQHGPQVIQCESNGIADRFTKSESRKTLAAEMFPRKCEYASGQASKAHFQKVDLSPVIKSSKEIGTVYGERSLCACYRAVKAMEKRHEQFRARSCASS